MPHPQIRLARLAAGALVALALAACGGSKSGRTDYVKDGDTGVAAPGTVLTPDNPGAPDSTSGMSQRTGAPGVAGTRTDVHGDSGIKPQSRASSTPRKQ
jgi:hypothetical protein